MAKYLITEEWNESDIKAGGHCESHVCGYGKQDAGKIRSIVRDMEKYSPYDYADYNVLGSEDLYEGYLRMLEENGGTITRYEDK